MSTHEVSRDEKVKCSLCPAITTRRNIARHRRNYHGDSSSVCEGPTAQPSYVTRAVSATESVGARSRSSSRDTAYSAAASTRCHSVRDSISSTSLLSQVAIAALDQHHCYTEEGLCRYVAQTYPEVSPDEIRPLVIGAVAGAKRATRLRMLVDKCASSDDASTRRVATDGDVALSFWLNGFRYPSRPDAGFITGTSTSTSVADGGSPASANSVSVPFLLQADGGPMQVSYTLSNVDLEAVMAVINPPMGNTACLLNTPLADLQMADVDRDNTVWSMPLADDLGGDCNIVPEGHTLFASMQELRVLIPSNEQQLAEKADELEAKKKKELEDRKKADELEAKKKKRLKEANADKEKGNDDPQKNREHRGSSVEEDPMVIDLETPGDFDSTYHGVSPKKMKSVVRQVERQPQHSRGSDASSTNTRPSGAAKGHRSREDSPTGIVISHSRLQELLELEIEYKRRRVD